jgi:hypothetical protein
MSQLYVDTITEKTSGNGVQIPGHVVQVVQTHFDTKSSTTTASWSTLYSASITPTSASNKVLAVVSFSGTHPNSFSGLVRVLRQTTPIGGGAGGTNYQSNVWFNIRSATDYNISTYSASYLDSPATTSAITYNVQWYASGGAVFYANRTIQDGLGYDYDSPNASSITLMEIAQ